MSTTRMYSSLANEEAKLLNNTVFLVFFDYYFDDNMSVTALMCRRPLVWPSSNILTGRFSELYIPKHRFGPAFIDVEQLQEQHRFLEVE